MLEGEKHLKKVENEIKETIMELIESEELHHNKNDFDQIIGDIAEGACQDLYNYFETLAHKIYQEQTKKNK